MSVPIGSHRSATETLARGARGQGWRGWFSNSIERYPSRCVRGSSGKVFSCDPRLLPKVSLNRGSSLVSSYENPRHSTNAMVPFSRAPLNLTIALFIAALSWGWRSCRSFFPRCAWRARESFDWTRGTTPTHTPPSPRLVWFSSISLSGWVANGSSHCSRCPTPPPPRPPSPPRLSPSPTPPPSYPPAPASTSRVPIPLP